MARPQLAIDPLIVLLRDGHCLFARELRRGERHEVDDICDRNRLHAVCALTKATQWVEESSPQDLGFTELGKLIYTPDYTDPAFMPAEASDYEAVERNCERFNWRSRTAFSR